MPLKQINALKTNSSMPAQSDSETSWAVVPQAPLSLGFSRQECWSGLPFLSPVDLPAPGIEPASPALPGRFFTTSTTWEAHFYLWPIHSSVANSWFNQ